MQDIIGAQCMGRQGLGLTHVREKSNPVKRRAMIQAEVRGLEEEGSMAKVVGLGSQGAWARLSSVEISFLEEFARTMGPLAKALNILQDETDVQMGWLLPTLTLLINKLERIHINSR
ncbi:hypothetical protein ROHU_002076 [Labeo rohita]|uniref:Uncharacterized protein n=1 Tax=Labeo rohita TaxID=84645 RepID=A0A498P0G0_LABRO|nr:hypothetical protein ROHU_002076 [Labeo rohita]